MFRAIIEFAIGLVIIIGTVGVIYAVYTGLHTAVYDPSVPHGELWRAFFGR